MQPYTPQNLVRTHRAMLLPMDYLLRRMGHRGLGLTPQPSQAGKPRPQPPAPGPQPPPHVRDAFNR